MNTSMIRNIIGYVLIFEGAFLALPCIVSIIYQEPVGVWYMIFATLSLILGLLLLLKKPKDNTMYLKEGLVATGLTWIVMSLIGCLPLWLSGEIPSFIDAFFETVSGFTTTGSSILSEVEPLSHTALFWRSLTHWIGGMGVLVFLLAIVPMSGGSHFNLMRAESPGPDVGKVVPKIKTSAAILYLIYFGLTVLEFILLIIGKMPVFDAVNSALATAGTGGFGFKNDSFMSMTAYQQWVVGIFMLVFATNFNLYCYIIFRQFKKIPGMEEIKVYLGLIVSAVLVFFFSTKDLYATKFEALTHAVFQTGTFMSSTGFASTDFDKWPSIAKVVIVILMFCGACAGSTGGGLKVSRIVIMIKNIGKEIASCIHPRIVRKVTFEGKVVDNDLSRSIFVYFMIFLLILTGSTILVSIEGRDIVTSFTSCLTCLNNMGPGLGEIVGPTGNFGSLTTFSKCVLIFNMLAGRLELFPILMLFHPSLYKSGFKSRFRSMKREA